MIHTKCTRTTLTKEASDIEATQNVKRKGYIPAYDSAMAWKRPQAEERVNIDFDALHETLSKKNEAQRHHGNQKHRTCGEFQNQQLVFMES